MTEETPEERTARIIAKHDLRGRLELVFNSHDSMEYICAHVSNGGSLIDMTKAWNVSYASVIRWIRSDSERSKKYDESLKDRDEWTIETIIHELRRISIHDIRQLYNSDNKLKPMVEWPDDIAKSVSQVKTKELLDHEGEHYADMVDVKLYDKTKAIQLIGKDYGKFRDSNIDDKGLSLVDILEASWKESANDPIKTIGTITSDPSTESDK